LFSFGRGRDAATVCPQCASGLGGRGFFDYRGVSSLGIFICIVPSNFFLWLIV
jgi:hypothetical protein